MRNLLVTITLLLPFTMLAQPALFKPQFELLNTKIDIVDFRVFLLNEPADKNFDGKFKVLEFWATWCRPCLKAVPHINKLQAKFKQSNLVFLSVTYEKPQKAFEAFKKVKFETIVVTDTTRSIHKKLRIDMNGTMPLPRTVLIDDENNIVWYGSPEKLTETLLQRFLRKERLEY